MKVRSPGYSESALDRDHVSADGVTGHGLGRLVRQWRLICLGVGTAALTGILFRIRSGADLANILQLPLVIASFAATTLYRGPSLERASRDLIRKVREERQRFLGQVLDDDGNPRPADVAFHSARPDVPAERPLLRWREDGGEARGSLRDAIGYYQGLTLGRLVIVGEPGAGKSVLASQLVIDLIEQPRQVTVPGPGEPRTLLPVWLSLPSLDLGDPTSLSDRNPAELAAMFRRRLVRALRRTYRVPAAAARELVEHGQVLPVLDGLDEMDGVNVAGPGPVRPRAAAVIRMLNNNGGAPVILVCRDVEYVRLAATGLRSARSSRSARTAAAGQARVRGTPILQDAQTIVLEPLTAEQIGDRLRECFPGEGRDLQERWWPVRDALHVSADAPDGAGAHRHDLLRVLGNPWFLYLATTAYFYEDEDPRELLDKDEPALREALMAAWIPAVIRRMRSRTGDGHHGLGDEAKVRRWLTTIARHLDESSRLHWWSPTDFQLHTLWPVAGWWLPRILSATIGAVLTAAPVVLLAVALDNWVAGAIGIAFLVCCSAWAHLSTRSSLPSRVDPSVIRTRAGRRQLVGLLSLGAAIGLGLGASISLALGQTAILAGGLAGGFAGGLVFGLRGAITAVQEPSAVRRQNLTFAVLNGVAIFAAVTLALWVAIGSGGGPIVGLGGGLAFGIAFGLWDGGSQWLRSGVAELVWSSRGDLPLRTGRFLNRAYDAGLLRLSGAKTQFRHREFQEWLAGQAAGRAGGPVRDEPVTVDVRMTSEGVAPAGGVATP
jgi:hypothetical protein